MGDLFHTIDRQSHRDARRAPHSLILGLPEPFSRSLRSNARHVALKSGEILFNKGDEGDGCYWVDRGILKVTVMSPEGEERILALLGPGAIVGELAMLDGQPRSATIQALRASDLSFISRTGFQSLLRSDGDLVLQLLDTLVRRLRRSDEEAAAASFLPVRVRVARALHQMMELFGEGDERNGKVMVTHDLRQTDIAGLAGVSRESVTRIIASLKREGILNQFGRFSYRIDRARLEVEAHARP